MSPYERDKAENENEIRQQYLKRYIKSNIKRKKPKYSIGDTVRIWGERGQFHCGYMEDYTKEYFIISKVLTNLPFPRYTIKEYNGDEVTGSFFEDELIGYKPSDLYPIEVIKKRKSKDGLEYLVHYIGWPHTYDEWKPARDIEGSLYLVYK